MGAIAIIAIQSRDAYDCLVFACNVALVLVGIGGIKLALNTLKNIERQTKAGEVAAKAALLNAQILANAERPWLLVSSEHISRTVTSGIYAKNRGRTPCKIVKWSEPVWEFIDAAERYDFRGNPTERKPIYGQIFTVDDPIILLNDESSYIFHFIESELREKCGSVERYQMLKDGRIDLYIFGRIYYRDLLNPEEESFHETGWCGHYLSVGESENANRLSMHGFEGYNYHT